MRQIRRLTLVIILLIVHFGENKYVQAENSSVDLPLEQILPNGDIHSSPFNPAARDWEHEKPEHLILPEGRIIAGRSAQEGEAPYLVVIHYKKTMQYCGGAIYNRHTVITAAHCFYSNFKKVQLPYLTFSAGEYDLTKLDRTEMHRRVNVAIIHPKYDPSKNPYDIAIIKFDDPVRYTYYVQPIPMAKANTISHGKLFIGGFGYVRQRKPLDTRSMKGGFSSVLKVATIDLVPKPTCEEIFQRVSARNLHVIQDPTLYCAGGQEPEHDGMTADACQGDSGGPGVCVDSNDQKYLCGLVATGLGCGLPGIPGIFTNISVFHSWIEANAGIPDSPTRNY